MIEVVGLLKSLESLSVLRCESLRRVGGLNDLKSLKYLKVKECMSLESLIDASCTNIVDDCHVDILECGDFIKDFGCPSIGNSLKHYKEVISLDTSNKARLSPQRKQIGPSPYPRRYFTDLSL